MSILSIKTLFVLCLTLALGIGAYQLHNWRASAIEAFTDASAENRLLSERVVRLEFDLTESPDMGIDELKWAADTNGQAAALVQTTLSTLAQQSDVNLRSIGPTNARPDGSLPSLNFRIEFEAELSNLVSLVQKMEGHRPILSIAQANMRRLARPGQKTEFPIVFAQLDIMAPLNDTALGVSP